MYFMLAEHYGLDYVVHMEYITTMLAGANLVFIWLYLRDLGERKRILASLDAANSHPVEKELNLLKDKVTSMAIRMDSKR